MSAKVNVPLSKGHAYIYLSVYFIIFLLSTGIVTSSWTLIETKEIGMHICRTRSDDPTGDGNDPTGDGNGPNATTGDGNDPNATTGDGNGPNATTGDGNSCQDCSITYETLAATQTFATIYFMFIVNGVLSSWSLLQVVLVLTFALEMVDRIDRT